MIQEWIPVGSLGDAFAPENNCLPPVGDLAGKEMTLHFENGSVIRHRFMTYDQMSWEVLNGGAGPTSDHESYVATKPRAGVYFVDFAKRSERATTVSLIIDVENAVFIAVIGQLPDQAAASLSLLERIERKLELTGVGCTFLRGTIDREFGDSAQLPQTTRDLIGKRVEYRYSKHENYEHIYLNDNFYSWHCLEGSEYGLCDTDRCHYYKIRDDLYLFVWREKVVPTLGVICVDLRSMKTTGKIFGYEENDFGSLRNFCVGAFARIVSVLTR
jgi:hypothetical protein